MAKVRFEISDKHVAPLKITVVLAFSIISAWMCTGLNEFIHSIFCIEKGDHFKEMLANFSTIATWVWSIVILIMYMDFDW